MNSELVLLIERTPDTTLVLVSGQRIMVQETPDEVLERVIVYRRRIGMPEALWNPNFADQIQHADSGESAGDDMAMSTAQSEGEE